MSMRFRQSLTGLLTQTVEALEAFKGSERSEELDLNPMLSHTLNMLYGHLCRRGSVPRGDDAAWQT